jgi:hypothetical protein
MTLTRAKISQRQRDKKVAENLKEIRGVYVKEPEYEQKKIDFKLVIAGKARIILIKGK